MNFLRAAILGKLGEPIDVLNKLQVDLEDRYRVPPLLFWRQTLSLAKEKAQETKKFYDGYPVKDAATNDVTIAIMNHLDRVYRHAEKCIIIFSKERIKN